MLKDILKKNPHIDPKELEEIRRLLRSNREAGVARNVYGLTRRPTASIKPIGGQRSAVRRRLAE
jgi:hypothetical protein